MRRPTVACPIPPSRVALRDCESPVSAAAHQGVKTVKDASLKDSTISAIRPFLDRSFDPHWRQKPARRLRPVRIFLALSRSTVAPRHHREDPTEGSCSLSRALTDQYLIPVSHIRLAVQTPESRLNLTMTLCQSAKWAVESWTGYGRATVCA